MLQHYPLLVNVREEEEVYDSLHSWLVWLLVAIIATILNAISFIWFQPSNHSRGFWLILMIMVVVHVFTASIIALFTLGRISDGSVLRHQLLSLLPSPFFLSSGHHHWYFNIANIIESISDGSQGWCSMVSPNQHRHGVFYSKVKTLSYCPYPIHNLTIIMAPYPIGGAAAILVH